MIIANDGTRAADDGEPRNDQHRGDDGDGDGDDDAQTSAVATARRSTGEPGGVVVGQPGDEPCRRGRDAATTTAAAPQHPANTLATLIADVR